MSLQAMYQAVSTGDLEAVQMHLNDSITLKTLYKDESWLIHAIRANQVAVVRYLCQLGSNPKDKTIDNQYALDLSKNKDPKILKSLVIALARQQKFIDSAQNEKTSDVVNKLITTLLYKSNRHAWNSELCQELKNYITLLDPTFLFKSKSYYQNHIREQETNNNTFYGSYLSSDSDSGEENAYKQASTETRKSTKAKARILINRAQVDALTYQRNSGVHAKGDLKPFKSGSDTFDLEARARIRHDDSIDMSLVEAHLEELNALLKTKPIDKALAELQEKNPNFTQFFVAEYRGVTHLTTLWNQESRKEHRNDASEIDKAQYSASVLVASSLSIFRSYKESKEAMNANASEIKHKGDLLKEIILSLREPKPYSYKGYTYSNLGYLLQTIYTQDYDGFHELIKTHPIFKHLLLNGYNPFISMGDTPYHSEKYAHGIKPYKGHEEFRLRPRWQENGQAERPYSGVVYASLHPLTDFTNEGPLHLVSLNRNAEIKLERELLTIPERESCFPAYLPEDRVFYKHKAKYPAFKDEYKKIYLYKYGMDKPLFEKFKESLKNAKPHTKEMTEFKQRLGEWLCSFHEVKMIELAREEARRRGGVLIYRGVGTSFSLSPPVYSVNANNKANTDAIKTPVKEKQALRASLSPTKTESITLVTDESSVNSLGDLIDAFHFTKEEDASTFIEGNSTMSMPLSLLVSAIKNKYDLALEHYLKIDLFQAEINKTFTTSNYQNMSLLHLAVTLNNQRAVELLLNTPQINANILAEELAISKEGSCEFYEDLSALHLAIINARTEITNLLNNSPKVDKTLKPSIVTNKDLLDFISVKPNRKYNEYGDDIGKLSPDDPNYNPDELGQAWRYRELWPIYRTRNIDLTETENENKLSL